MKRNIIGVLVLLLVGVLLGPMTTYAATDKTKPAISGATHTTAYLDHSFDPKKGVKAKDNVDGDINKMLFAFSC